jgi:FkbM family methyltransferase
MLRCTKRIIRSFYTKYKGTLNVKVGGLSVCFETIDPISKAWFYPRYMFGRLHEPAITNLILDEISKDDIFYDLGSNVGWFTLITAKLLESGEVHAFEVDPRLSNLEIKSFSRNIVRVPCFFNNLAVTSGGKSPVSFKAHSPGNLSTNSLIYDNTHVLETNIRVGSVSIDEYCAAGNSMPNIMKIDIEGGEYDALRGMSNTLKKMKPKIILEIHPVQLKEIGVSPYDIVRYVTDIVPQYKIWEIIDYRQQAYKKNLKECERDSIDFSNKPKVLLFKVVDEK